MKVGGLIRGHRETGFSLLRITSFWQFAHGDEFPKLYPARFFSFLLSFDGLTDQLLATKYLLGSIRKIARAIGDWYTRGMSFFSSIFFLFFLSPFLFFFQRKKKGKKN